MQEKHLNMRPLSEEENNWISNQRQSVEEMLSASPAALNKLVEGDSSAKLSVLEAILKTGLLTSKHTFQLQGMGIILGEILAEDANMNWMMLEDEYGTSPCLTVPGTSITLFPQTMISKRVENGELVDVFEMANALIDKVEELRGQGA